MKDKHYTAHIVYEKVSKFCFTEEEKIYALDHAERFAYNLNTILGIINTGMKVASIGISILDPLMQELAKDRSFRYFVLIPNDEVIEKVPNPYYRNLEVLAYDFTSNEKSSALEKFDVVLFYETLEHMMGDDKLILSKIAEIIKPNGFLLGSVPNAAKVSGRFNLAFGKNIYWPKKDITKGVFGGYGHIREYTFKEIESMLSENFDSIILHGRSPYAVGLLKLVTNWLLPGTFRSIIYFEATRNHQH